MHTALTLKGEAQQSVPVTAKLGVQLVDGIQQDDAHLVAGDEPIAALSIRNRCAAAVTIRVGTQQQVRVDCIAQLQTLLHGFPNFRVRIGAGGEVAVRLFLLRYHSHMGDTQLCQQLFNTLESRTVERRIDQLQTCDACTIADVLCIDRIYLQPILHHGEQKTHTVELTILPTADEDPTEFYLLALIIA